MSLQKFKENIDKALRPHFIELKDSKAGAKLSDALENLIFGGKGPTRVNLPHTTAEIYISSIFTGFTEITESYYTLREIETLISAITLRNRKIKIARILTYHVHNYLNENYIIAKRLEAYPTKILRLSGRYSQKKKKLIKEANKIIRRPFTHIISVRDSHVHEKRYSDDELDRLSILERFNISPIPGTEKFISRLFRSAFVNCKNKWMKRIRNNNDELEELLDQYFDIINVLVFNKNGDIILPSKG